MQKLIACLYVPVCNINAAKTNFFFQFPLILSNCHQQMCRYGLVDNYVRDQCHITSSLYKTDTSLRQTVEASPEGVRF